MREYKKLSDEKKAAVQFEEIIKKLPPELKKEYREDKNFLTKLLNRDENQLKRDGLMELLRSVDLPDFMLPVKNNITKDTPVRQIAQKIKGAYEGAKKKYINQQIINTNRRVNSLKNELDETEQKLKETEDLVKDMSNDRKKFEKDVAAIKQQYAIKANDLKDRYDTDIKKSLKSATGKWETRVTTRDEKIQKLLKENTKLQDDVKAAQQAQKDCEDNAKKRVEDIKQVMLRLGAKLPKSGQFKNKDMVEVFNDVDNIIQKVNLEKKDIQSQLTNEKIKTNIEKRLKENAVKELTDYKTIVNNLLGSSGDAQKIIKGYLRSTTKDEKTDWIKTAKLGEMGQQAQNKINDLTAEKQDLQTKLTTAQTKINEKDDVINQLKVAAQIAKQKTPEQNQQIQDLQVQLENAKKCCALLQNLTDRTVSENQKLKDNLSKIYTMSGESTQQFTALNSQLIQTIKDSVPKPMDTDALDNAKIKIQQLEDEVKARKQEMEDLKEIYRKQFGSLPSKTDVEMQGQQFEKIITYKDLQNTNAKLLKELNELKNKQMSEKGMQTKKEMEVDTEKDNEISELQKQVQIKQNTINDLEAAIKDLKQDQREKEVLINRCTQDLRFRSNQLSKLEQKIENSKDVLAKSIQDEKVLCIGFIQNLMAMSKKLTIAIENKIKAIEQDMKKSKLSASCIIVLNNLIKMLKGYLIDVDKILKRAMRQLKEDYKETEAKIDFKDLEQKLGTLRSTKGTQQGLPRTETGTQPELIEEEVEMKTQPTSIGTQIGAPTATTETGTQYTDLTPEELQVIEFWKKPKGLIGREAKKRTGPEMEETDISEAQALQNIQQLGQEYQGEIISPEQVTTISTTQPDTSMLSRQTEQQRTGVPPTKKRKTVRTNIQKPKKDEDKSSAGRKYKKGRGRYPKLKSHIPNLYEE